MLKDPSSFRDPSGFVFEYQGEIYRSINQIYEEHYEFLNSSGLLNKLLSEELLIRHQEVTLDQHIEPRPYKIIKPEKIPVISYPYEWGFSQLKEAALLTLRVQLISLEYGMILKDASAYNVQFKGSKPVFIDSLSFAKYREGQSWNAYRQFCEHFLAPLCLGSYLGISFLSLSALDVEGVPLKMASKLLPSHTWLKTVPLMHLHLHARMVDHYAVKTKSGINRHQAISKRNLLAMVTHLKNFIEKLHLNKSDKTQWQNYDKQTHYSTEGRHEKAVILKKFIGQVNPSVIWDIGGNDGFFSRIVADENRLVLSLDADPLAIEKNFHYAKEAQSSNLYSLLFNLANPSSDAGWANQERKRLSLRSKPDLIMALALIHHIVITHNIPFEKVAEYFAGLAEWLIIEFVPPDDEKIIPLPETAGKASYSRKNFTNGFYTKYQLLEEIKIADSKRTLLLLKKLPV
jgi:hypothetical protein